MTCGRPSLTCSSRYLLVIRIYIHSNRRSDASQLHTFAEQQANRRVHCGRVLAIHTTTYPVENAHVVAIQHASNNVLAVAGPPELAVVLSEPVHVENLSHFLSVWAQIVFWTRNNCSIIMEGVTSKISGPINLNWHNIKLKINYWIILCKTLLFVLEMGKNFYFSARPVGPIFRPGP